MKKIIALGMLLLMLPLSQAIIFPEGGTRYIRYYFTSDLEQTQREVPRKYSEVHNAGIDGSQICAEYQWYRNKWYLHEFPCTNPNLNAYDTSIAINKYYRGKGYVLRQKARWAYPRSLITGEMDYFKWQKPIHSRIYG